MLWSKLSHAPRVCRLADAVFGMVGTLVAICVTVAFGQLTLAQEMPPQTPAPMQLLLPAASSQQIDFEKDIRPVFKKHCYECHSGGNEEGGLNLGVRQRTLDGGQSGPPLVRGDSAQSPLIQRVAAIEASQVMPPVGDRLSPEEVGLLRAWIDQGAPWPDGLDEVDPRQEKAQTHWAFQPLAEVPLPSVQNAAWCRTPVDAFVLSALEQAGLTPAPQANARTLLRRLSFDLIGLPPTLEELAAFEAAYAANSSAAIVDLVDRLLNSPHFGERWGQHWLDLAHYADSDGMESDRDRPNAYAYRDFVIRAVQKDMPYNQFVKWQIAGDEYDFQNPAAVAATGFLATGPHEVLDANLLEEERLRARYNELDDCLSTIGTGLLGLTLGCARCHDHKYDAITSRDYYRLLCAIHGGDRQEVTLPANAGMALAYKDNGTEPAATWLFHRANFYDHSQPVTLGFVPALLRGKSPEVYWQRALQHRTIESSSFQRRALADWLTDVDQGAGALLARVIVNRLWQHHFGEPLVKSVGDFGVRSEPPTHPELLEWLAQDLVSHGWSLSRLHRQMLQSAAYAQASYGVPVPAADEENRLLWKMRSHRLEAEPLRDSMLMAAGTLNLQAFGPAFKPPIAQEAMVARNLKDAYPADVQDGPALRRRSVYMFHKRVVPYPLMQAFDKPDAQQSCGRRNETTVAPQALALLNDPFVRKLAEEFADRVLRECGSDMEACIRRAYGLALTREPRTHELAAAAEFVARQTQERQARAADLSSEEARRQALTDFCQTIFSLNEFVHID